LGSGTVYTDDMPLIPPGATQERYLERDLETYMRCPARYRFTVVEGLRGGRDDSAYISFHRCVYQTVRWLETEREAGKTVGIEDGLRRLSETWQASDIAEHPFEPYYRRSAEGMVRAMVEAIAKETGQYERDEWEVPVGRHRVVLVPDRVVVTPEGAVSVQRVRTGRETKSEPDKPIYALLRRGAASRFPRKKVSVETFYLAAAKSVPTVAKNDDKAIGKYADAIAAIELGRLSPIRATIVLAPIALAILLATADFRFLAPRIAFSMTVHHGPHSGESIHVHPRSLCSGLRHSGPARAPARRSRHAR
jgi:hypothetical protein